MRRPGAALAAAGLLALALPAGCRTGPATTGGPAVVIDDAAVAAALARHRERVDALARVTSRGVIELRWRDEEGEEHFEPQVDAHLWIERPRRTALRGEKVGRDLLWLGSDDERFWFFDMMGDESRLFVASHADAHRAVESWSLPIAPLALLDLMGLTAVPGAAGDGPGGVTLDAERDAWIVHAAGAGGRMRLFLDRTSGLPVRVESIGPDDAVVLASDLGRYRSVDVPGVAAARRPRMPTLIDIADPAGTMSVKLALGTPEVDESAPQWGTVFDLAALTRYFRPDHVHDLGVHAGAP
jgi:hypothetical protein